MSRLKWTLRAQRDLLAIGRFIAADNPDAARHFPGLLRTKARVAARFPRAGRHVPELERDDIREIVVRSYRIIYRVAERDVTVLAVFESHRAFPTL